MCGIVGIFAYHPAASQVDQDELRCIRDSMKTRGPDGVGEWFSTDGRVGLGHRRLAIIDLSEAASQPMTTRDGNFVISFNGEIYNYQQLRQRLENEGFIFQSRSDTEVLLHLYAQKGEAMVHDLRGMFAFVLWDATRKAMFLARDPYGIKPLYYTDNGKTFRVASQVKALLASEKISRRIDPAGVVGFFLFGSIPEPFTTYEEIKELPAGSFMWIDQTGPSPVQSYFSVAKTFQESIEGTHSLKKHEVQEIVRDALLDSIRHHFVADVPVGIFLSSGIDSGTLVGLAKDCGMDDLRTVTLAFKEFQGSENDEAPLAEMVARQYQTRHYTYVLSRKEFMEDLPKAFEVMDQPTIDGMNTYFVSKAAAQAGIKVILSGIGGDELFGGYPSFRTIPLMTTVISLLNRLPFLADVFQSFYSNFLGQILPLSPRTGGILKYGGDYAGAYFLRRGLFMPWELNKILEQEFFQEGLRRLDPIQHIKKVVTPDPKIAFARVASMESAIYLRTQLLRDADWAGMAHSLEIRTPYVDAVLLKSLGGVLAKYPSSHTLNRKHLLAGSLSVALPQKVLSRAKTGFTIPMREWLQAARINSWKDLPILRQRNCHWSRWWAYTVAKQRRILEKKLRVLVLVTDAFGGRGGIAQFNRDFLKALCHYPLCGEVVALPRVIQDPPGPIPQKLRYVTSGVNNKLKYLITLLQTVVRNPRFDLIICGHIHLLPLAFLMRLFIKAPVLLIIYGVDAWRPSRIWPANCLVRFIDTFLSISEITRQRFLAWTGLAAVPSYLLPNTYDPHKFFPGRKSIELLRRYHLAGKKVLMTLGRLAGEERYKGFDEVLELLPDLIKEMPDLVYLIAGDGSDRGRLQKKARSLGIEDRVIFTGYVSESEKADHYRLADAFVMPGRGEGFGIVFLEAMACGIPVVASKADGSREAVLDGKLGILVDPSKPEEIKAGIRKALQRPRGVVPEGLDYFSYENFQKRVFAILSDLTQCESSRG